eukprot:TRINITY_DN6071_c0_g1_i1.p1 TRINITY_DN6071_c0_g1~~TRINITY_DN6071_c0_g1_i1.p1  ORF type:complete len:625 (+),score=197.91 TRINITY_DN6071_c0_g1_i1:71-1945(+)
MSDPILVNKSITSKKDYFMISRKSLDLKKYNYDNNNTENTNNDTTENSREIEEKNDLTNNNMSNDNKIGNNDINLKGNVNEENETISSFKNNNKDRINKDEDENIDTEEDELNENDNKIKIIRNSKETQNNFINNIKELSRQKVLSRTRRKNRAQTINWKGSLKQEMLTFINNAVKRSSGEDIKNDLIHGKNDNEPDMVRDIRRQSICYKQSLLKVQLDIKESLEKKRDSLMIEKKKLEINEKPPLPSRKAPSSNKRTSEEKISQEDEWQDSVDDEEEEKKNGIDHHDTQKLDPNLSSLSLDTSEKFLPEPQPDIFDSCFSFLQNMSQSNDYYTDYEKNICMFLTKKKIYSSVERFCDTFHKSYSGDMDEEEVSLLFYSNLTKLTDNFKLNIWKSFTTEELRNGQECLEKYLMTILHEKIFSSDRPTLQLDIALQKKVEKLDFIKTHHLNISPNCRKYESLWLIAGQELKALHTYTAPVDKIICIMRAFTLVTNSLKMATGSGAAADDLLSILVYVIVKSNPPLMHSNIKFLRIFRDPSFSLGAGGYNLATLEIAIEFVGSLNSSKLVGIDENDFTRMVREREKTMISIPRAQTLGFANGLSKGSGKNILDKKSKFSEFFMDRN